MENKRIILELFPPSAWAYPSVIGRHGVKTLVSASLGATHSYRNLDYGTPL